MLKTKKTLAVYGAGGTGCNLVFGEFTTLPTGNIAFPDTTYAVIDTSSSNLVGDSDKDVGTYLIPGVDGSGKNQALGYEYAKPHMDTFLNEHKPGDFNIVIFGAAGGTGSIVGPMVISELTKRGKTVVAICIGSTASGKEAGNTLRTITNLQNMSMKMLQKPVAVNFYMNSATSPQAVVDGNVGAAVSALATLASGANHGLDSKDLHHWLNYQTVTEVPPQLVDLVINFQDNTDPVPTEYRAISVASLLTGRDDHPLDMGQPYGTVGYLPEEMVTSSLSPGKSIHFILTNGLLSKMTGKLKSIVDNFRQIEEDLSKTPVVVLDAETNDDGFML